MAIFFTGALGAASCMQPAETNPAVPVAIEAQDEDDPDPPIMNGGATGAYKTCQDMFSTCQDIGGGCTRGFPGCDKFGQTSCGTCFSACLSSSPYPPACRCRSCGFTE